MINIPFSKLKLTRALIGGLVTAIIIFLAIFITGNIGSWKALEIIMEMRPSLRFTCSAVLTATSTILALILTLLSFSSTTERSLRPSHYVRVQWIARFAITAFIASLFLLLLLILPLQNAPDELSSWFESIYYGLIVYSAMLGGIMVSIVLMLYQAAHEIILVFHPDVEADHLYLTEEERQEEEAQETAS